MPRCHAPNSSGLRKMPGRGTTSSTVSLTWSGTIKAGPTAVFFRGPTASTAWAISTQPGGFVPIKPTSPASRVRPGGFPPFTSRARGKTGAMPGSDICEGTASGSWTPGVSSSSAIPLARRSTRKLGCPSRITSCSFSRAGRHARRDTTGPWATWPWRRSSGGAGICRRPARRRTVRFFIHPTSWRLGRQRRTCSRRRRTRKRCVRTTRQASTNSAGKKICVYATRRGWPSWSGRGATGELPARSKRA